jgi:hypothetical protein
MSDNLDYSRCPNDGCKEVNFQHKNGGRDGKGHEYRDWQIFHADPRAGGCGHTWSTATRQGLETRTKRNAPTRGLTRQAAAGVVTSVPSEQYMERWDAIDWSR